MNKRLKRVLMFIGLGTGAFVYYVYAPYQELLYQETTFSGLILNLANPIIGFVGFSLVVTALINIPIAWLARRRGIL